MLQLEGAPGSLPCTLKMNPGTLNLQLEEGVSCTITHPSSAGHRPAVGIEAIETTTAWKFNCLQIQSWACLGVICNENPSNDSFSDPTCFGWGANGKEVFLAGSNSANYGGWPGKWKTGDTAILMLDLEASQLKLSHIHTEGSDFKLYTIPLPTNPPKTWRLHVNLHGAGDEVKISIPTAEEVERMERSRSRSDSRA